MTYGAKITLGELFDLLYDTVEEEIENKDYKEPHPSCSHYKSIEQMKDDIFCPKCGSKNQVVSYPKPIRQTYYRNSEFNPIKTFKIDKKKVMVNMVTEIYWNRGIKILDNNEEIYINVTATGDDRFENSFVYFHPHYLNLY